jgi:hypothetical protein
MEIDASKLARSYLLRRGGDLYVWFGAVGKSGSLLQHVSTHRAPERKFERYESGGLSVWWDATRTAPKTISLRRRPWPLGPIEVTWEGGAGGELGDANITAGSGWS